jgi:signal transduction histidine kinase
MGGTGLGLAIAKEIMDSHGGGLDVKSSQGEGTIVTVTLPRG